MCTRDTKSTRKWVTDLDQGTLTPTVSITVVPWFPRVVPDLPTSVVRPPHPPTGASTSISETVSRPRPSSYGGWIRAEGHLDHLSPRDPKGTCRHSGHPSVVGVIRVPGDPEGRGNRRATPNGTDNPSTPGTTRGRPILSTVRCPTTPDPVWDVEQDLGFSDSTQGTSSVLPTPRPCTTDPFPPPTVEVDHRGQPLHGQTPGVPRQGRERRGMGQGTRPSSPYHGSHTSGDRRPGPTCRRVRRRAQVPPPGPRTRDSRGVSSWIPIPHPPQSGPDRTRDGGTGLGRDGMLLQFHPWSFVLVWVVTPLPG